MVTIAVANQKGGVGKTVTVANLGFALAKTGKRVLLVDLDPQASLSLTLGVLDVPPEASTAVLLSDARASLRDILQPLTEDSSVSIAPASEALAHIAATLDRADVLAPTLARLSEDFDIALIDTPPSLGWLPINALAAARYVLIPVQAAYLAMHGLAQAMNTVERVREAYNPSLQVLGILLTMYDRRTILSEQVEQRIRQHFAKGIFNTVIHRTVRFDYATIAGKPVLEYDPRSEASAEYQTLAKEVLKRAKETKSA